MIDVTKFVETLGGKPVALFGLGISNIAAIKALVKAGAKVFAWDDSEERCAAAEEAGATIKNLVEEGLAGYGCLVLAPGVPLTHPAPHPVVERAQAAGVEILCDIEILHRCDHGRKTIGITGTNGKSTTTALIGHVLNECGIKAVIGGNIGKAALDLDLIPRVPMMDGPQGRPSESGHAKEVIVLELSSYQIDLCPTFKPDIAVLLNVTPDHIDRHGDMEGYKAAKMRLFADHDRQVKIAYPEIDPCVRACQNMTGDHNLQNASAALQVCEALGLNRDDILAAIKTFPGLAHRQYPVRVINGVSYINDSKATNAEATGRALVCYRNIYWIVGGKPKEGGLNGLEPYRDHIAHAYLIGEAAADFGAWLDNHAVPHEVSETLDRAVVKAHRAAQEGRGQPGGAGVVLLSPACASFDQFKSFEERGDLFTTLVDEL